VKFGEDGLALGNVMAFTLPGIPLIYTGEEVGNRKALGLFEKVGVDWSGPSMMGVLFKELAQLRRRHPALVSGGMERLPRPSAPGVYAFMRSEGTDTVAVFLNFGAGPVTVEGVPGAARDAFTGTDVPAGTPLSLGPKGYRVLAYRR